MPPDDRGDAGAVSEMRDEEIFWQTVAQLMHDRFAGEAVESVLADAGVPVFFRQRQARSGFGHRRVECSVEAGELRDSRIEFFHFADAVDDASTLYVKLEPGDRIMLYTDGLTDVFDSHGEMLKVEGLQSFVCETALLPFGEMRQGILNRVAEWRDGPPLDDVSLVLVEVR